MSLIKESYSDERKACMEKYGNKCISCKMNFADRYGKITPDLLILYKISVTEKEGVANDLVPVCPNCYAVLNLKNIEMTIEEVRERLKRLYKVYVTKGTSHKERFYTEYFFQQERISKDKAIGFYGLNT